jgi:hypothetical protein
MLEHEGLAPGGCQVQEWTAVDSSSVTASSYLVRASLCVGTFLVNPAGMSRQLRFLSVGTFAIVAMVCHGRCMCFLSFYVEKSFGQTHSGR